MRSALLAILLFGCGAGTREAPFSESGKEVTGCDALGALAPNLLAFIRSQDMEPMAEVVQTELVKPGLIQNAFAAVIKIIAKAPPPSGMLTPLSDLVTNPKSASLGTLVGNVMRYLAGQAPATKPHYEVTTALGKTLTECDHNGPLTLIDKLITTHLPYGCKPGTPGCALASTQLLSGVGTMISNPTIRTVLSQVNYNAIGPDAFVTLLQQVTTILSSPTFDFAQIKNLLVTNVYPLITDASLKSQLDALLDVVQQVTAPETGVQQALVGTLACATKKDPNGAIDRMLYDIIADPSFQAVELLGAASELGSADPNEKVAGWLHQVIGLLQSDPATNNALINVIGAVLGPDSTDLLIPGLIKMGEAGVLGDLSNLVTRTLSPCSDRPVGTGP